MVSRIRNIVQSCPQETRRLAVSPSMNVYTSAYNTNKHPLPLSLFHPLHPLPPLPSRRNPLLQIHKRPHKRHGQYPRHNKKMAPQTNLRFKLLIFIPKRPIRSPRAPLPPLILPPLRPLMSLAVKMRRRFRRIRKGTRPEAHAPSTAAAAAAA